MSATQDYLDRYETSLMGVFGRPQLVLDHGAGVWVWDVEGRRYLDLVGGIAVNALGHGHPALVAALSKQVAEAVHVSNFFTTPGQIALAEQLLEVAEAPQGSAVFFANSGAEAIEAAIKVARRTGRTGLVAAEGAFHGRTTGALALTHKEAYRAPFEPLLPGVTHVPYGDVEALRAAVTQETGAVILEPIQGEAGVLEASADYLRAAREITSAAGALLVIDEIQTGIGRTGSWFAFQRAGIVPDAITIAKGLGGGVPVGALIALGPETAQLLQAGQHGTTFGGNPLAAAAGLAVLETIRSEGLLAKVAALGTWFQDRIGQIEHPLLTGVRGVGLLQALTLAEPVAAHAVTAARAHGIILNAVSPTALRIAPPLIITEAELDVLCDALPAILDEAAAAAADERTQP
ncbi:acetylornithine transaminase [Janibacter sp. G1551]|uniref:acetylornithine transaminase n=1 Tax=Janibacter sp. G1551 TaxID=3420440 RepID=UPI003CFD710C